MTEKGYTVIIIPPKASRIRQYRLPKFLLRGLCSLLGLLVFALGYTGFHFVQRISETQEVDALRRQSREQKAQIQWFAIQIQDLKENLTKLNEFDRKLRILANLQGPAPQSRLRGVGGSVEEHPLTSIFDKEQERLIGDMRSDLDRLNGQMRAQEESLHQIEAHMISNKTFLAHTPALWPVRGWVTSTFGPRTSPFTSRKEFHTGLDIATPVGTSVIAPADGLVVNIGAESGYGKVLTLDHGYGFTTRYSHVSNVAVKLGERVKRGQSIAQVGNTGRTTGPHLHYEIWVGGVPVNPQQYILD